MLLYFYTWLNSPYLISKVENLKNNIVTSDITYSYYSSTDTAKNRIKSIKSCSKVGTTTCKTIGYGYTFHSNGMLKDVAINTNEKTSTYTYDAIGNLTQYKNPLGHIRASQIERIQALHKSGAIDQSMLNVFMKGLSKNAK